MIPRQYHCNTVNVLHHCYWWSCFEVNWWISCVSHCILLILGSCVCYYGDLWQGPIKPVIIGSGVTGNPTLFLCRPFLMNYVDSWLFLNFFFFEGSRIFTRTALQVNNTSAVTNKQYFNKRRNCVIFVCLIINRFSHKEIKIWLCYQKSNNDFVQVLLLLVWTQVLSWLERKESL